MKPNQTEVMTFRMRNWNEISNNKKINLVFKPKESELSYFRKKLLTHSERTMCECVVEHTGNIGDDSLWKAAWLCMASEHRISEFGELQEVLSNRVPITCQHKMILKRVNELKSFEKVFSLKSEIDDGLSSFSNVPERSTDTELTVDKNDLGCCIFVDNDMI